MPSPSIRCIVIAQTEVAPTAPTARARQKTAHHFEDRKIGVTNKQEYSHMFFAALHASCGVLEVGSGLVISMTHRIIHKSTSYIFCTR